MNNKIFISQLYLYFFKLMIKFLIKIKLLKHGFFVDRNDPFFRLRTGSYNSIWVMRPSLLVKLSLMPKLVQKKDYLNYTPPSIKEVLNKINPRCWDIIELSIKQKVASEKKKFYFPIIDINNYEIAYRYFQTLIFYKSSSNIIVEFNKSSYGGFGHLIMELFPILIYLSLKLPLIISIKGLNS